MTLLENVTDMRTISPPPRIRIAPGKKEKIKNNNNYNKNNKKICKSHNKKTKKTKKKEKQEINTCIYI
jgi:hypothetical protein